MGQSKKSKSSKKQSSRDRLDSRPKTVKQKLTKTADYKLFSDNVLKYGLDFDAIAREIPATEKACRKFWNTLKSGVQSSLLQKYIKQHIERYEILAWQYDLNWDRVAKGLKFVTAEACAYYWRSLTEEQRREIMEEEEEEQPPKKRKK